MGDLRHKGMEDNHLPLERAHAAPALPVRRADPAALTLPAFNQLLAEVVLRAFWEHLHARVTVIADGVDHLPYHDFLLTLPSTTCIGVLHIDPPGMQACIDLPRGLIDPVPGPPVAEPSSGSRVHTSPETRVLSCLAGELGEAWTGALEREILIRFESLESSPASLHIMPADERVTVFCLETTRLGTNGPETSGIIRLCLPEPVVQHLVQLRSDASLVSDGGESAVDLRVVLAETKLRLSDLLSMQVGDIIMTDQHADAAASVELDDSIAAPCRPGQLKGMRAVRVTHSLSDLMAGRSAIKQRSGESP